MKTTFCFLGIMTLLVFGCEQRLNQSSEELGSDAVFRQTGRLGYIYSSRRLHRMIMPNVLRHVFNDSYILAVQMPDSSMLQAHLAGELNTGKEKITDLLLVADSLIAHDPYYKSIFSRDTNYWIIDNRTHTLFGPLGYNEYVQKRDSLKIPPELEL